MARIVGVGVRRHIFRVSDSVRAFPPRSVRGSGSEEGERFHDGRLTAARPRSVNESPTAPNGLPPNAQRPVAYDSNVALLKLEVINPVRLFVTFGESMLSRRMFGDVRKSTA